MGNASHKKTLHQFCEIIAPYKLKFGIESARQRISFFDMNEPKSILIVEDDEDIRTLTNLALTLDGFETYVAGSGAEALRILETSHPDIVLLDVVMRGMDGFQTFKEMERIRKDLPVIFLTARVQNEEVSTYLALGAVGVIAKPFDVTQLGEIIRNIWNAKEANA